jgi:hypothetical protein
MDILKKLLANAFDTQLTALEHSAQSQLTCVETSKKTANSVALLCSTMSKQVVEKLKEKEKRATTPRSRTGITNHGGNMYSSTSFKSRAKTPRKGYSSNKSFSKLNMTMREGSKLQLNNSNGSLLGNKKQLKTSFMSNKSYNQTINNKATYNKKTNLLGIKVDHNNTSMFTNKRTNQISKSQTSSGIVTPSNLKTSKKVQFTDKDIQNHHY